MPQFLNKKLILLLAGIIVLVALIGFSLRERETLSWPEQFLKDTTGWFANAFDKPVSAVTGLFENLSDLQNTYDENAKLKARLGEYVQIKTEVQALKKENAELRKILGKEDDLSKYSPIQATVIGRNPDRWNELITINKGEMNGIKANMAVITADGLIGKVKSTTPTTATVLLVSSTDPNNKISASIVQEDAANGIIEGYDDKQGYLLMKRIPFDKEIKIGSIVETSGLGGIFPSRLIVGKVVEVKIDQNGLNQTAYLEPATDFYDIKNVMVVKREVIGEDAKSEAQE
ncbi:MULTISPECIES: rod shape-determining protein MreC [Bacillaceae]|uniref:Cell shape-determining protein MreC n=1 Tax=Peribacillus huizhouensis TaxID=1501239 RepID=A0ABR6CL56_9BACI|nr:MULTISPECIES: rod shape-determining protein MreC [Bacillaceae]MBA9025728.1 rod shape-determining protein MreC [Peribacillus huizhouensis]